MCLITPTREFAAGLLKLTNGGDTGMLLHSHTCLISMRLGFIVTRSCQIPDRENRMGLMDDQRE